MRSLLVIALLFLIVSCKQVVEPNDYKEVKVEVIHQDSISVRAIEIMDKSLAFATNKGKFGSIDLIDNKVRTKVQQYDFILPEFRAVAATSTDFFMLSVANPALLYKTGGEGQMQLVYKEEGASVFYDAMDFWNDMEGIAIGDSMNGCLSIIVTRDGGNSWNKISCDALPKASKEEGAFAASNTNIAIVGDEAWIATTSSRIYHTSNKGATWELFTTPIEGSEPTSGIYSIDFYDENIGFAIGGDYTKPKHTAANKAITIDGGKTWKLVANEKEPGYKSCVQFVPGKEGKSLVAVGYTGISYSKDMGNTWEQLSEEPFYTLRFLNDSIAYGAGQNRIAKLIFK